MKEAIQRLSSGGAGESIQATPDQASCEGSYPALTCNELLGGPSLEPRNLILFRSHKPRKLPSAERGGDSCKLRCQNGSDDTQRRASAAARGQHSSLKQKIT